MMRLSIIRYGHLALFKYSVREGKGRRHEEEWTLKEGWSYALVCCLFICFCCVLLMFFCFYFCFLFKKLDMKR